jgi:hypothetical protein
MRPQAGGGSTVEIKIKLFPGSSRDASPEKVAEQVNKAIAQMEAADFASPIIAETRLVHDAKWALARAAATAK